MRHGDFPGTIVLRRKGGSDMSKLKSASVRSRLVVAGFAIAAVAAGCATSKRAPISSTTQSSFLGDYSRLQPGSKKKDQVLLRYINPAAQWKQYTKVMIDPVTFWGDEKSKVKPNDQKALTTYFHAALRKQFGQFFRLSALRGLG
jgi:ABC-type transporter MlaC component